jgi:hypothetical protein
VFAALSTGALEHQSRTGAIHGVSVSAMAVGRYVIARTRGSSFTEIRFTEIRCVQLHERLLRADNRALAYSFTQKSEAVFRHANHRA